MTPAGVGIVGCGWISDEYFSWCPRFEDLEIVACTDIRAELAEAKAREYGVGAMSADELLASDRVDVILNLTPLHIHAEVTTAAIEAGKHVYSEKPLALDSGTAAQILEAAQGAGVRVGCAPDTFLGGGLQTCRKIIDDGWIGEPVAATCFVSYHGYEHWHPNVEDFYEEGTGPMFDNGPYYVAGLLTLLGPARRVTGSSRKTFEERVITSEARFGETVAVKTPTHITGIIDFESGAIANLTTSWDIWASGLPYGEIYGTEGTLSITDPDSFGGTPRIRRPIPEDREQDTPPRGEGPWFELPLTHTDDLGRGIGLADMMHAVRTGRPHRASGELALHTLEVMEAFNVSSAEGRHVEISRACARPAPLPSDLLAGRLDD